ncbi:DUF4366 domain-containing protein [Candidatus Woesearchaeota archaeon]|nr:DUF4366 domain-containing protein [Candidatus Woesearchaeota archaeon]
MADENLTSTDAAKPAAQAEPVTQPTTPAAEPTTAPATPSTPSIGGGDSKKLLWIGLSVVGVLLIGFAAYWFFLR